MRTAWKRLGSSIEYDAGIFRLRKDRYERDGAKTRPYFVLEAPAWVNVVAVTPENEVVMVRQYRHGIEESTLEIPGGIVDPGDADPAAAAERELLEETGYAGRPPELLGAVSNNPAILDNRTYCYVMRDARRVAEPTPDEDEELSVELHPAGEVPALLTSGTIHHSLCVCALALFQLARHA